MLKMTNNLTKESEVYAIADDAHAFEDGERIHFTGMEELSEFAFFGFRGSQGPMFAQVLQAHNFWVKTYC